MMKFKQLPWGIRFWINAALFLLGLGICFVIGMAIYAGVAGITFSQAFQNLFEAIRNAAK